MSLLKGRSILFSEWGPTLVVVGVGSLGLVGLALIGFFCYYGSKGTAGCCRVLWACLRRFEVELHEPQCACISVRKKKYCPTQEAEKAGEYCRNRRDGEHVDLNSMASDEGQDELNAPPPPSIPTYRAVVKRGQGAPVSQRRLRALKAKVLCAHF